MNARVRELWLQKLRDGQHRQTRGTLRNESRAQCCLGVLCETVEELSDQVIPLIEWELTPTPVSTYVDDETEDFHQEFVYKIVGHGWTTPPEFVREVAGLSELDCEDLIELNDGERQTFGEIADFVEANH